MVDINNIHVIDYSPEYDQKLVELSYKSLFYNRKEFEYVRAPPVWIERYSLSEESIKKIALYNGKIVGSLGVIIRDGIVNGKETTIGCLVDNCLDPEYLSSYELIFDKLFAAIENEAKNKKVDVLQGWDFEKTIQNHPDFFSKRGYEYVTGVNWFPGGSNPFGVYPSFLWKFLFKIYYYYFRFYTNQIKPLPSVVIKSMSVEDYPKVSEFISEHSKNYQFGTIYKNNDFKKTLQSNNIHGFIAQKDGEIIGVLTYFLSAWSGWMFGKPFYNKNFTVFLSYTPDEFYITPKYQETTLGSLMIIEVMKMVDPHINKRIYNDYLFNVDVFHNKIYWRKNSFKKIGYSEPAFDYGVIIAKSLRKDIHLDASKLWLLPARYILSPVLEKNFLHYTNKF